MFSGPGIIFGFRHMAVVARLGGYGPPSPVGVWLAKAAAWCAIGAVACVLALPVLALLSALI